MTRQEQISEGQGEGPKEKKTMVMKKGESKNYKQLNKRELILLENKIEVYFAQYIILFFIVVVVVVTNHKRWVNNVVRTLQKKFTKLFHGKTMRKTHKSQGRGQEEEKPWGEGEQTISCVPRGANRKEGND